MHPSSQLSQLPGYQPRSYGTGFGRNAHVRIVPFSQDNELAELIDHSPKNPESLLEGGATHLPFPVRFSLGQSVIESWPLGNVLYVGIVRARF